MIPDSSLWRLSSMASSWYLKDFSTFCASHFKMRVPHFAQLGILIFVHFMFWLHRETILNLAKDLTNCWPLVVDSTFSTVERVEQVMFCSTPMKSLTMVFFARIWTWQVDQAFWKTWVQPLVVSCNQSMKASWKHDVEDLEFGLTMPQSGESIHANPLQKT